MSAHPSSGQDRPRVRPRVAVLFGGRSSEHAISCVTAGSVLAAIDRDSYDVVPIGIARDGRWVLETGDLARLTLTDPDHLPEVDASLPVLSIAQDGGAESLLVHEQAQPPHALGAVDVVFPVLHGPFGEDGTIQGLLEIADVRYVGSGVLASAVGMDKQYMKMVLEAQGLPVMPSTVVTGRGWREDPDQAREASARLGFPLFVKPCRGGSSIGISKVEDPSALGPAIDEALRWDPKVLVEAWAGDGAREIECGVLQGRDGAPAQASVVAEILVQGEHDFYDFEAKYLPEQATELAVPADVPAPVAEEIRRLATAAFDALSCEGLARVDFFLLPDGRLVVNEINTMPGFTPTSMFPRMWAESGVSYADLVDRLISLALERPIGLR